MNTSARITVTFPHSKQPKASFIIPESVEELIKMCQDKLPYEYSQPALFVKYASSERSERLIEDDDVIGLNVGDTLEFVNLKKNKKGGGYPEHWWTKTNQEKRQYSYVL